VLNFTTVAAPSFVVVAVIVVIAHYACSCVCSPAAAGAESEREEPTRLSPASTMLLIKSKARVKSAPITFRLLSVFVCVESGRVCSK
jgi:hypothetical protein